MTMTGEYRSGLIATTFMATPGRTLVVCAKAVVAALFSAVVAALMVIGSVLVARLVAAPGVGDGLTPADTVGFAAAVALYAAL
ncbi:ABC transporter permease, partial [Mycobacterium sp. ITM-2017-0098]